MNRRNIVKVLVTLLVVLLIISTISFADYTPDQFKSQIDTTATGTDNIKSVGGKIVGIVQVVGTIASIGMLIVLGIKYMMGSAEERAEYKKTLFPYFIGAILIFAATNLADIIYSWAESL